MKTLIIILVIASFIQTTILPVNLVLLVLICRAYIKSETSNLYLAFAFGIVTAHLNLTVLGLQSLVYLVAVWVTHLSSKLRLAGNPLLIVPVSLVFLFLNQIVNSGISYIALDFPKLILQSLLSLPIFYLVKMWEERFIVRKEIKLKI